MAYPERVSRQELAQIAAAEAHYLATRKALVAAFLLHQQAKAALGELQLVFLKKVLCVDDGQVPEVMRLHEPELQALLHRRHTAGAWELEPDAPNFRLSKETGDRLKVEIVETEDAEAASRHAEYVAWAKNKSRPVPPHIAEMRAWWRANS